MAEEQEAKAIQAEALKFFADTKPANKQIQQEIFRLVEYGRKFIILSGPPGVGKTRSAEDFVLGLLKAHDAPHSDESCRITTLFPEFRTKIYPRAEIEAVLSGNKIKCVWDFCVLHPQYSYEDLIRGFRLSETASGSTKLEVREGMLGFMSRVVDVLQGLEDSSKYPLGVLILDEINRAPIGQIFGEAIYALDRRDQWVSTPYELENLGSNLMIPRSLLLLGTMNSVDRAISGFDFALRRRFTVLYIPSEVGPIERRFSNWPNAKLVAVEFYTRIRNLIVKSRQMGVVPKPELIIGHSYFLPPENIKDEKTAVEWLGQSYQVQILSVLLDYQEQGLIEYRDEDIQNLPCGDIFKGDRGVSDIEASEIEDALDNMKSS